MKQSILAAFFLTLASPFLAPPPNCEIYKEDKKCYEACLLAIKAIRYKQGSAASQMYFDQSIAKCANFAYSYQQKAVPYLKRGAFIEWFQLINKAVELAPEEYLGYRAWCRLQFLRDYKGAINDIEKLKKTVSYDIGYCQNGNYHLNVALGLCYKELGQLDKAQEIIETQIYADTANVGLFDYYHLGVIKYLKTDYNAAIKDFDKQLEQNPLSEVYYYKALSHEQLNDTLQYTSNLKQAIQVYEEGYFMQDTYTEPIDKVYYLDIRQKMKK